MVERPWPPVSVCCCQGTCASSSQCFSTELRSEADRTLQECHGYPPSQGSPGHARGRVGPTDRRHGLKSFAPTLAARRAAWQRPAEAKPPSWPGAKGHHGNAAQGAPAKDGSPPASSPPARLPAARNGPAQRASGRKRRTTPRTHTCQGLLRTYAGTRRGHDCHHHHARSHRQDLLRQTRRDRRPERRYRRPPGRRGQSCASRSPAGRIPTM